MNNKYIEPEFKLVNANCEDVLTISAGSGDPYNMMGDNPNFVNYHNRNWMIPPTS